MWLNLFAGLFWAHLTADFILQSNSICQHKSEKNRHNAFIFKEKASRFVVDQVLHPSVLLQLPDLRLEVSEMLLVRNAPLHPVPLGFHSPFFRSPSFSRHLTTLFLLINKVLFKNRHCEQKNRKYSPVQLGGVF